MDRSGVIAVLVIATIAAGWWYNESTKKKPLTLDNFHNYTNTDLGQEFVKFIESRREEIKTMLLANGCTIDNSWDPSDKKTSEDWLQPRLIAIVKDGEVLRAWGDVSVTGTKKDRVLNIATILYFSFYFHKENGKWLLATDRGYFVPSMDPDDQGPHNLPPEIYAGMNRIFPDQFQIKLRFHKNA